MKTRHIAPLVMVGSLLAGGMGARSGTHAAPSTVSVSEHGYTITIPARWKQFRNLPIKDLFKGAALQKLSPTFSGFATADAKDSLAVVVTPHETAVPAIKALETAMMRDGSTAVSKMSFQTAKQDGKPIIAASASLTQSGKKFTGVVGAISHAGKTYYFLAAFLAGTSATVKADGNELGQVLDSIKVK